MPAAVAALAAGATAPAAGTASSPAVVLVGHGSADPQAAVTVRALAGAVAAARPGVPVRAAFLDHSRPRPDEVLYKLASAGHAAAVVLPLLLTAAYHHRVDLPELLLRARQRGLRLPVRLGDVLGPVAGVVPDPLVAALARRLREAGGGYDALVLAAAGTRDPTARATVELVAARLGAALGVPCRAGYASGGGVSPGEAVAGLRAAGARRVAVSGYFLATGKLYRVALDSARVAGATVAAPPLADAPELVDLLLSRLGELTVVTGWTRSAQLPGTA